MKTTTGKAALRPIVDNAIEACQIRGIEALANTLHETVLKQKVKFPLLEYVASEIYKAIPEQEQLGVTDSIIRLGTLGGNVIAGFILQQRLADHLPECFTKAVDYIIMGDEWYVCDIIGERVMGHGLLMHPEQAMPMLKELARHDNKWIVRSVGVAAHYAVKKGLKKRYVHEVFGLLLQLADTTDFHTKKGVGWAAKTIAKFHPDIIVQHEERIEGAEVKQWFKTKIKIGLGRTGKYAHRYTS